MHDQPIYRITVQGRLNASWIDWLNDMDIIFTAPDEHSSGTTTIIGEIRDQALLLQLLNFLYDMQFPLLSLTLLDRRSAP